MRKITFLVLMFSTVISCGNIKEGDKPSQIILFNTIKFVPADAVAGERFQEIKYKGSDVNTRAAADAKCKAVVMPIGKSCIDVYALASFPSNDNLKTMPSRLGFSDNLPIKKFDPTEKKVYDAGSNWASLIEQAPGRTTEGMVALITANFFNFWSFSNANGENDYINCISESSTHAGIIDSGMIGTSQKWSDSSKKCTTEEYTLLCMCLAP